MLCVCSRLSVNVYCITITACVSVYSGEKKKRGRPRKQKVVIESDDEEGDQQTYTSLEAAAAEPTGADEYSGYPAEQHEVRRVVCENVSRSCNAYRAIYQCDNK